MRKFNQVRGVCSAAAIISGMFLVRTANADTYFGNGNTGFGGPVGTGSLTVVNGDDGNGNDNVTFSFMGGSGHPTLDGNDFVLYLSTGAAGLTDTSTLSDNGDGGREAISGANNTNGTRTLVTFPTGFQATYAISVQDAFVGLFHLVNLASPPSLDYVGAGVGAGVTQSSASGGPDTVTIPLSILGLSPGQTFQFVGTDIATGTYRSNEAFGGSDAPAGGTNIGDSSPLDFSSADTFSTPEPSSLALLGLVGLAAASRRRRLSGQTA